MPPTRFLRKTPMSDNSEKSGIQPFIVNDLHEPSLWLRPRRARLILLKTALPYLKAVAQITSYRRFSKTHSSMTEQHNDNRT